MCKSFLLYPNYFEFVDCIQFYSVNDKSLYDDYSHNEFKSDLWLLDALLSFEMKSLIQLFVIRLSLAIKHITNRNYVDKDISINDRWIIKLLDKKQLYRNEEAFPNFNYKAKGIKNRVGKIFKINDIK